MLRKKYITTVLLFAIFLSLLSGAWGNGTAPGTLFSDGPGFVVYAEEQSQEDSTEIPSTGEETTTKISAPASLKVKQVKNKCNAVISWKKSADPDVKGYKVYRKKSGSKWKLIKTTKKLKVTDKKLKVKKTYAYKVTAYKAEGETVTESDFSEVKKVKIKLPKTFRIKNVNNINQYSIGYSMGCEIVSLAVVLRYLGFSPKSGKKMTDTIYYKHTKKGNSNLSKYYYGNPHGSGSFGACYETVIADSANSFLSSKKSKLRAHALKGKSVDYLFEQVALGRPVCVWASEYMQGCYPYSTSGGTWWSHSHTLVLTGYDKKKGKVYMTDPERGKVSYRMSSFKKRYSTRGKRAVVIY